MKTWLACNKDGLPAQRLICDLDARISNTVLIPLEHVTYVSDSMQVVHYDVDQHYRSSFIVNIIIIYLLTYCAFISHTRLILNMSNICL